MIHVTNMQLPLVRVYVLLLHVDHTHPCRVGPTNVKTSYTTLQRCPSKRRGPKTFAMTHARDGACLFFPSSMIGNKSISELRKYFQVFLIRSPFAGVFPSRGVVSLTVGLPSRFFAAKTIKSTYSVSILFMQKSSSSNLPCAFLSLPPSQRPLPKFQ